MLVLTITLFMISSELILPRLWLQIEPETLNVCSIYAEEVGIVCNIADNFDKCGHLLLNQNSSVDLELQCPSLIESQNSVFSCCISSHD